jgi:hypothetical protein
VPDRTKALVPFVVEPHSHLPEILVLQALALSAQEETGKHRAKRFHFPPPAIGLLFGGIFCRVNCCAESCIAGVAPEWFKGGASRTAQVRMG